MSKTKKRKEIRLEVRGERESAQEFVGAWKRAARHPHRGSAIEHVYFLDVATMLRTLTKRRMELLHDLHRRGPMTVRALAIHLKRDYKNVHADVKLLRQVGLIELDETGKAGVPWDRIAAEIQLAA